MLSAPTTHSTSYEIEQLGKRISEGHIQLLPKEVLLKIYEYYLFDLHFTNKINFNLVCKYFNTIANDKNFYRRLLEKYCPITLDYSCHIQKIKTFNALGFDLPPIDKPEEFIPRYVQAVMLRGKTYQQAVDTLKHRLPDFYEQLQNRAALLNEMKSTFATIEINKNNLKKIIVMIQGYQTHPENLQDLTFIDYVLIFLEGLNFRNLVNLFTITDTTSEDMALRVAAGTLDFELVKELVSKKLKALRGFYQTVPEELMTLEKLIQSRSMTEIRKVLAVDFDVEYFKRLIGEDDFVETVEKGNYDDIFQKMTPQTLKALKNLSEPGNFQCILLARLVKANRFDLIPLLKLNEINHGPTIEIIADQFLLADKARGDSKNPEQAKRSTIFCDCILANSTVVNAMVNSIKIARWSFENKNEEWLRRYFDSTFCRNLYSYIETDLKFVTEVFTFALHNKRDELVAIMMNKISKDFIPHLVKVAHLLKYPATFMNKIQTLDLLGQQDFFAELVMKASSDKDHKTIDLIVKQISYPQHAGEIVVQLLSSESDTIYALSKLSLIAKFDFYYDLERLALKLSSSSHFEIGFLKQFFTQRGAEISLTCLMTCMDNLTSNLASEILIVMFSENRFSNIGDATNYYYFLKRVAKIRQFTTALCANPELLISLFGDTKAINADTVLDVFCPFLDTKAKLKLLSLPLPDPLHRNLLLKYPNELDYFTLNAHFGKNHPLLQQVPQPGLFSLFGNFVAGYLPAFSSQVKNPPSGSQRSHVVDKVQDKENKPSPKKQ